MLSTSIQTRAAASLFLAVLLAACGGSVDSQDSDGRSQQELAGQDGCIDSSCHECGGCPDLDGDGLVNASDLARMRAAHGTACANDGTCDPAYDVRADLDADGDVDDADLGCLQASYFEEVACFGCIVDGVCEAGETPETCAEDCGACTGCADLTGDGLVNAADLARVRTAHGSSCAADGTCDPAYDVRADLDGDSDVDDADVACMQASFFEEVACFDCIVDGVCEAGETPETCAEDCGACTGCADLTGDGLVNAADLARVRTAHGSSCAADGTCDPAYDVRADLDGDSDVDDADVACLQASFFEEVACFDCIVDGVCEAGETPETCAEDCGVCTGCPDLTGDGLVNAAYLAQLRVAHGSVCYDNGTCNPDYDAAADLDGDGDVDDDDLGCLQASYFEQVSCAPVP